MWYYPGKVVSLYWYREYQGIGRTRPMRYVEGYAESVVYLRDDDGIHGMRHRLVQDKTYEILEGVIVKLGGQKVLELCGGGAL